MIYRPLILLFFGSLLGLLPTQSFGQSSRYLLLKNRQLIEGKVEKEKDKVWVEKQSGSRIAYSLSRVELISDNLSELYWARYGQLPATDGKGHTVLFYWCLEKDLFDEAQNQIEVLQTLRLSPRKLLQLSDRLVSRMEQSKTNQPTKEQIVDDKSTTPVLKEPKSNAIRDPLVSPASFNAALEKREAEASRRQQHLEKLNNVTRGLPGHSVVMFKRKIEPIVMRSCYTAKCHSNDIDSFRLQSAGNGISIPKRMSQANLYHVMKFTNSDRPLDSKLLAAAVQPHAGMEKPVVKIESEQFQLLRLWLISISNKPFQFHAIPQSFLTSDLVVETKDVSNPKSNSKEFVNEKTATSKIEPSSQQPEKPIDQENSGKKEDPFDPEKFNRRYLNHEGI